MSWRRVKNTHEGAFQDLALASGWTATKRGWPDFLCTKPDGSMIAVEVKPRSRDGQLHLKASQALVFDIFTAHHIPCFVSDGHVLEPYNPSVHAVRLPRARAFRI